MNVAEELLTSAFAAENGIAVKSADIEHLRRRLQAAKDKLVKEGFAWFNCLKFRTSPHELTELWIIKSEVPNGATEHGPGSAASPDQETGR